MLLGKVGLFAPRQALTKLFRHFDHNLDEKLDYRDFIEKLSGELSLRRENIIGQVWDKLASGADSIPVKLVIGAYSAEKNPRVLSGEKTAQQVFREFVNNFENAGNVDGMVSFKIFFEFYRAIAASVPYNDDYFCSDMELSWSVTENSTNVGVPTALVRKVENLLREKIRQRAKKDGAEVEGLRLTFKFFDLEQTGLIDYKSFTQALERYGIQLTPEVAAGLYADFEQADGRINYSEFVAALFHGEALVPSYTGLSQTIPGGAQSSASAIFIIGGPCSGAPAVSAAIKEALGYVYLDTVALVDAEQRNRKSELGRKIASYSQLRKDVPSSLVMQVITRIIQLYVDEGKSNFVLDGFPRTLEEHDAWEEAAEQFGFTCPVAVHLEVPTPLLIQRMCVRDPARLTVDARIAFYETQTLPLVSMLETANKLVNIEAAADMEQVKTQVLNLIGSLR
jgi:adenylate kinase family enzyme/Ca2+-binding EF-hand superfamily protein